MSWLPTDQPEGWIAVRDRPVLPDAAAMVLEPRVRCTSTGERIPFADACYRTCLAQCGVGGEWTEAPR
jgi:hypothetical protein